MIDTDHLHPVVMRPRVEGMLNDPRSVAMGIGLISAYRSPEYQAELYRQAVQTYGPAEAGKWVAPPWHSNHGPTLDDAGNHVPYGENQGGKWGCAVDLSVPGTKAVSGQWPTPIESAVNAIAADHGLYSPMDWEDWHFEPIPNWTPAAIPQPTNNRSIMRAEVVVVIPPPRADGAQVVAVPGAFWSKTEAVALGANDDGRPVPATIQPCHYYDALLLTFVPIGTEAHVPQGMVRVILSVSA